MPMYRSVISVGLLLLLGRSLAVGHDRFAAPARETKKTSAEAFVGGLAPGETSQDDHRQLRAEALANAEVRVTARRKNPRISRAGLDPAVLSTLVQQQEYLASRPAPQGPSAPSKHLVPGLACNAPMIRSVNGTRSGAIFTPQAPRNFYTIEGCSFGSARGHVQLESRSTAFGQPIFPIFLQLAHSARAWSDREISVYLDPHLSGVPDSPVTLVIYVGSGQRLEMPGCFFVAVRGEPRFLPVIPATWVKFDATTTVGRSIRRLGSCSPPVRGGEVPKDAAWTSALVIRSDSDQFAAGSDTYDFSQLGPGWIVDSVQLQTYAISCPADITYAHSFGRWDIAGNQRSFTISWEGGACTAYALPL